MAAGIMNKIAEENDLDVQCESAGIFASDGAPATAEAIGAAWRIGVDISEHKAKNITPELIAESDLILTMTEAHKMMLALSADKNVYTLGEYAGSGEDVSDPYGGEQDEYNEVCDEIYDLLLDAAERIYDEYFKDGEA
jgi:protein-tyrosine-phosphatase